MDETTQPAALRLSDQLGPVQGAVLDRNGWPTLIVRGNEEAHVKHAGASYLYTLTAEEVAAVNKLRARKARMTRDQTLCRCDHNEYCEHCWPESFRPGGVWHGLGAYAKVVGLDASAACGESHTNAGLAGTGDTR